MKTIRIVYSNPPNDLPYRQRDIETFSFNAENGLLWLFLDTGDEITIKLAPEDRFFVYKEAE